MRWALVALAACGSTPPAPAPVGHRTAPASCATAAAGLDRATRDVRDPDTMVRDAALEACAGDGWPEPALACFTGMAQSIELGRCAALLPPAARDKLFGAFGAGDDRTAIAIAIARLASLEVGIPACDRFVDAVATALGCDQLSLEERVGLGNETADFWSLPTSRLRPDAIRRMERVCDDALARLATRAAAAGCK